MTNVKKTEVATEVKRQGPIDEIIGPGSAGQQDQHELGVTDNSHIRIHDSLENHSEFDKASHNDLANSPLLIESEGILPLAENTHAMSFTDPVLTIDHSRQKTPREFISYCHDTFPGAESIPDEQLLILRNTSFPNSFMVEDERNVINQVEEALMTLFTFGHFVVTFCLVLRLRKRDTGQKVQLSLIDSIVQGDVIIGGKKCTVNYPEYTQLVEALGATHVQPEHIKLSAQPERPKDACYKPVVAVKLPDAKTISYFTRHLPYVHRDALPLLISKLNHATTDIDRIRVAHLIGMLGQDGEAAIDIISHQLRRNSGDDVRGVLVDILGDIGSSHAIEVLLEHNIVEHSASVREIISSALRRSIQRR